jgi:hypothetical protein
MQQSSGEVQQNQTAGFPNQTGNSSSFQDKSNNSLPLNLPNNNLIAEDFLYRQKDPSISSDFHSL